MKKVLKSANFFLNSKNINPSVLEAEYAVRGIVPIKAAQIGLEIKNNPDHKYPFDEITFCNIGNPQNFNQKPITFNRQVLSCVINPDLLKSNQMHADVKKRAQRYLDEIVSAGSYTESLGIASVRGSIARYIAKNDNVEEPSINNVFLTEGASQGVHIILQTLIRNKNDGIMIPIPQYPLYSASIALNGGVVVPYYLNEEKGWQLDVDEAEKSIELSKKNGVNPRAIVVINPGNPTGTILKDQTIQNIIRFATKNQLIIIADEVYRDNIYKNDAKFSSFRKILNGMSSQLKQNCELVSLNSISKGILGECGLRGGYMELFNIDGDVQQQLLKLKSIFLCSNSIGQLMVDLMCDPPLTGVAPEISAQYKQQSESLLASLKERAILVTQKLNQMKNIKSQVVQGSMYAFPSLFLSKKAIEAAGTMAPDLFYCLQVLKNTGIALVPGSGFKQRPGTYHFRITTLILPIEKLRSKLESLTKFNDSFHQKYE